MRIHSLMILQSRFHIDLESYEVALLCCSAVDFGAGWWAPSDAFGQQKALNAPGMSPPFCSEF